MAQKIDEIGNKYGKLAVISSAKNPGNYKTTTSFWRCLCLCGKEKIIRSDHLRSGKSQSCGHCSRPVIVERNGSSKHYLFQTWGNMMSRCYNKNLERYKDYGELGIKVFETWHAPKVFISWIEENLGQRPEGHSLDRINVYGNYEPGNLRWASSEEQINNRRLVLLSEEEYELVMRSRYGELDSRDEAVCVGM